MIFDPTSKRARTRSAYKRINPPIYTRRLVVALMILVPVIGCFQPSTVGETCDAIVGDLVVSEFLPNPAGSDFDREWFEIYNASSKPQVLDRLVVRRLSFKAQGQCVPESDFSGSPCYTDSDCINSCKSTACDEYCSGPYTTPEEGLMEVSRHVIRGAGVLAPHSFFVLSDGERSDIKIDYNYSLWEHEDPSSTSGPSLVTESLGDMSQDIGGLALACKGHLIDQVLYGTSDGLPTPIQGETLSFSGATAPDAILNDDPRWWCAGTMDSQDEIFGQCALDGAVCMTDDDCESARTCSGADKSCVDDLDCAEFNQTGTCGHDGSSPCTTKGECLEKLGVCDGENDGIECADKCECGSGCGECTGYEPAVCNGVVMSSCVSNSCSGYVDSNLGTPGEVNPICPFVAYDTCMDTETERDIQFPEPGDLVLTELFADPASTDDFPTNSDDDREWIEIYVNSQWPIDINGLAIVFTKTNDDGGTSVRTAQITQPTCLNGQPGQYLVLGQSADPAINGGVTVDGVLEELNIYNNEELKVELILHGTIIIDTAMLPKSTSGKSSSLSPGTPDPTSNDVAEAFCKSEASGAFGGGGTPGTANACTTPVGCLDNGVSRVLDPPAVGELVISELLFDPSGSDGNKEWIELYNVANRAIDLNGLEIINYVVGAEDNIKDAIVGGTDCVTAQPGQYVLIGAIDDALSNGNLSVDGVADGLSFYNTAPGAIEIKHEGLLIDKAVYPDAGDGHSLSLKPGDLTAVKNDTKTNFCVSETEGNYDGYGTPGGANLCGPACSDSNGYRQVNSPAVGDLVVTEIMANPDSTDSGWEWFEVYVAGSGEVDLNGLDLVAGNGNSTRTRTIENGDGSCITVQPGTYAVMGGDMAGNEGFGVEGSWGASELFYNSGLTFSLRAPDGTEVDGVAGPITAGTTNPAKSHVLDASVLDAVGNDGSESWCRATISNPVSLSFYGSPGLANQTCP